MSSKNTDIFEIIKDIKKNINIIHTFEANTLAKIIKHANYAYHSGDQSGLTDAEYDAIREVLESIDNTHPVLSEVGSSPNQGIKAVLPYYMGSLNKIKSDEKAIKKFINNFKNIPTFVISDKLDGVSALLAIRDSDTKMYTRGDGKVGQDISHLIPYIKGIPGSLTRGGWNLTVRGELIISKDAFSTIANLGANARNTVSGIVNSKLTLNNKQKQILDTIQFIAYTSFDEVDQLRQSDSLALMSASLGFNVVHHTLVPRSMISLEFLTANLKERKATSPYEIDGLVIETDTYHHVEADQNPSYAFAYKSMDVQEVTEVQVIRVNWSSSKDGYLVPVVEFDPVHLSGVTVKKATGFNAQYIYKHSIGSGALIRVTRSGDVIPFITEVIKPASTPSMPDDLEYEWTESGKDIVLVQPSTNQDVQLKQLESFFVKLDIKGLRRGTLEKLYHHGFTTLKKLFNASIEEIKIVPGFSTKSATNIVTDIKDGLSRMKIVELMDASNAFGRGFGHKRLESILNALPRLYTQPEYVPRIDELIAIEGVSDKTASNFVKGLTHFRSFLYENELAHYVYNNKGSTRSETNVVEKQNIKFPDLKDQVVVFTGFRDSQVKKVIEENGGKVEDSITKNTTLLVAKDDTTTKVKKAKEKNIKVVSLFDFKQQYPL